MNDRPVRVRLASLARDSWQLRSGEDAHAAHPETFWIPPLRQREALRRGDGVKLVFDVEGVEEDGRVTIQGEKMWVIVAERRGDVYIGRLENEPDLVPDDDTYLRRGAEIPFLPEHVVDIQSPPAEYVAGRLAEPPTRRWPPGNRFDGLAT